MLLIRRVYGFAQRHTLPEFIAFDDVVAADMARWCNRRVINAVMRETGAIRNVVKYDALIVACARAHKAAMIITLDADVAALAEIAGVTAKKPDAFSYVADLFDAFRGLGPTEPHS